MAEAIELDRLEVVVKNLDDFLLGEACKTNGKALDLLKNLTYSVVIFS